MPPLPGDLISSRRKRGSMRRRTTIRSDRGLICSFCAQQSMNATIELNAPRKLAQNRTFVEALFATLPGGRLGAILLAFVVTRDFSVRREQI
jgi:hypothetical protein